VLVKLERFDEVTSVVDHLNKKHTVLLNLESTSKDISRRLIDFLSGVTYVIKGQLKQVSNSAFLITPYNVDIIGDAILDELESSGLLFKH
jgi:cell division inhibitor SepF